MIPLPAFVSQNKLLHRSAEADEAIARTQQEMFPRQSSSGD
jgi:hypothetical protein